MKQSFYYTPVKYSPALTYFLYSLIFFGVLVSLGLVMITLFGSGHKPLLATIKDFVLVIIPLVLIGKLILSNKETPNNTPLFIFDENRMIFNHAMNGFDIAWQEIEDINQSMMFNIPTLVIYTKNKKYKVEMKYFDGIQNAPIYTTFKEYASQYSGKKLVF